jgi:hypothetical protein
MRPLGTPQPLEEIEVTVSITLPTNIPAGDRRPVLVTGIATPPAPPVVYVDRDGDEWHTTGRTTADGQPILECPEPLTENDRGEGPSFPWTLRMVELSFGPLTRRGAVAA